MAETETLDRTMQGACFSCKHRRDLPGDTHSQCKHPDIQADNPMAEMFALLKGRMGPMVDLGAILALGIIGDRHGVAKGWFNWPWSFDPIWLIRCNGFESKEEG